MSKHVFSQTGDDGIRRLAAGNANDTEFDRLMNSLGWELPDDIIVTHLEDSETFDNSPRCKVLATFPRLRQTTWALWGEFTCDVHWTQLFELRAN